MVSIWRPTITKYSPDQPRSKNGEFGSVDHDKPDAELKYKKMSLADVKPKDVISGHKQHDKIRVDQIIPKDKNYFQVKGTRVSDGKKVSVYMSGGTKRLVSQHPDNGGEKPAPKPKPEGNEKPQGQLVKDIGHEAQILKEGQIIHMPDGTKMMITGKDTVDAHGGILFQGINYETGKSMSAYFSKYEIVETSKVGSSDEQPSDGKRTSEGVDLTHFGEKQILDATQVQIGDVIRNAEGKVAEVGSVKQSDAGVIVYGKNGEMHGTFGPGMQVEIYPGASHVFEGTIGALNEGDHVFLEGAIFKVTDKLDGGIVLTNANGNGEVLKMNFDEASVKNQLAQIVEKPNEHGDKQLTSYDEMKVGDTLHSVSHGAMTIASITPQDDGRLLITGLKADGTVATFKRDPSQTSSITQGEAAHAEPSGAEKPSGAQKPSEAGKPATPQEPVYEVMKKPLSDFKPGDVIIHPKMGDVKIQETIPKGTGPTHYQIKGTDSDGKKVSFYMAVSKPREGRFLIAGGAHLEGASARTFLEQVHSGVVKEGWAVRTKVAFDKAKCTLEETAALRKYTGGSYDKMNEYLRTGSPASYKKDCLRAQAALEKNLTDRTFIVSRKSYSPSVQINGLPPHGAMKLKDLAAMIKPGTVLRDEGFQSTSMKAGMWFGEVRHVITIPPGVPAAYVKAISYHPHEEEVVIGAGLASIVTGVHFEAGGTCLVVERTIIPPDQESSIITKNQQDVFDQMLGFSAHGVKMTKSLSSWSPISK